MQQRDTESLGFSIVNYKGSKDDLSGQMKCNSGQWLPYTRLDSTSTSGRKSHVSVAQGRKKLKKKPELSPSDAQT